MGSDSPDATGNLMLSLDYDHCSLRHSSFVCRRKIETEIFFFLSSVVRQKEEKNREEIFFFLFPSKMNEPFEVISGAFLLLNL